METKTALELRTDEAWNNALKSWKDPSIPYIIAPNPEDINKLEKNIAQALQREFAFMQYPEFQTYANLENISGMFQENPQRGLAAILKHEVGHRFCAFDTITAIMLTHAVEKELESEKLPYDPKRISHLVCNLFTDMCINTNSVRAGDKDLPWAYQEISKKTTSSKLWNVYGRSMELAWKENILPINSELTAEEQDAAKEISAMFERDFFDKSKWRDNIKRYARIIKRFLEDEQKDRVLTLDDITQNIPSKIDEKTSVGLAKRLAELGSDGLPTNSSGLKEFKEIMAGFGQGDSIKASIHFYDMLSSSYDVMFAAKPFGRPRTSPFQPEKWQPSMGADKLDVDYSVLVGGKIIPGVTTYTWNRRKREIHGGIEEVIPNLDIYLDSSSSMPNPIEEISLPVLAGFVVAKKAHRKGAKIKATNFSGKTQLKTTKWTRNLLDIFETLVTYYNGGTVFPTEKLLENGDPKQVLVITDTVLANPQEATETITELKRRHKGNGVAIYAIHAVDNTDYLRNAGAEVIHGTNIDIFKKTIGKADEVYAK